jgi:hypothetical protein
MGGVTHNFFKVEVFDDVNSRFSNFLGEWLGWSVSRNSVSLEVGGKEWSVTLALLEREEVLVEQHLLKRLLLLFKVSNWLPFLPYNSSCWHLQLFLPEISLILVKGLVEILVKVLHGLESWLENSTLSHPGNSTIGWLDWSLIVWSAHVLAVLVEIQLLFGQ